MTWFHHETFDKDGWFVVKARRDTAVETLINIAQLLWHCTKVIAIFTLVWGLGLGLALIKHNVIGNVINYRNNSH